MALPARESAPPKVKSAALKAKPHCTRRSNGRGGSKVSPGPDLRPDKRTFPLGKLCHVSAKTQLTPLENFGFVVAPKRASQPMKRGRTNKATKSVASDGRGSTSPKLLRTLIIWPKHKHKQRPNK